MDREMLNSYAKILKNHRLALKNLQKQHNNLIDYINETWKSESADKFCKEYGKYSNIKTNYNNTLHSLDDTIDSLVKLNREYDELVKDAKSQVNRAYTSLKLERVFNKDE